MLRKEILGVSGVRLMNQWKRECGRSLVGRVHQKGEEETNARNHNIIRDWERSTYECDGNSKF